MENKKIYHYVNILCECVKNKKCELCNCFEDKPEIVKKNNIRINKINCLPSQANRQRIV